MGWIIIIAATVFMYRLADMADMSPGKWAVITFFVCLGAAFFIPWPLVNLLIGLVVSYGMLAACKMTQRA